MPRPISPRKLGINNLTYRPNRAPYLNALRLTTHLTQNFDVEDETSVNSNTYECAMCGSPCSNTRYCANCNTHLYTRER